MCLSCVGTFYVLHCPVQYSGSKPRNQWEMWHPTLVAEAVFAIANIFSSLRLISLFTANSHLGPLQISLGRMLLDILKFLFIYCLVNAQTFAHRQQSTHACISIVYCTVNMKEKL